MDRDLLVEVVFEALHSEDVPVHFRFAPKHLSARAARVIAARVEDRFAHALPAVGRSEFDVAPGFVDLVAGKYE